MTKAMMTPQEAAQRVQQSVNKRYAAERRFQLIGKLAIATALGFLVILMSTIVSKGVPGFFQHYIQLDVTLDAELLDPRGDASVDSLFDGNPRKVLQQAVYAETGASGRKGKKEAFKLVSSGAQDRLRAMILDNPNLLGTTQRIWFAVDDDVDSFLRGYIKRETPESDRRLSDRQIGFIDELQAQGKIEYQLSDYLFSGSASRNAEMAGVKGAVVGSILTLTITLLLAFQSGGDGGLPGGIRTEESIHRDHRSQYQQLGGGTVGGVWYFGFGGVYRLLWLSALIALGRGFRVGADDLADHHYLVTGGA